MTLSATQREFIPGTTGWSVDDLDDPAIERLWNQGRYEIVEGVLTLMPAAQFDSGLALKRLIRRLEDHTVAVGLGDGFAMDVDLVLGKRRLPVVDAIFLTPAEMEKQREAHAAHGRRRDLKYGRILVPPTLIIESISLGHEAHDRETKRAWYAEAQVPNYWILDGDERALECLTLEGDEYRVDQAGRDDQELRPRLFPGLTLRLAELWA